MKALTLHQPWASLIALGVKTIETRHWATTYRGPLAIHAGKQVEDCGYDGSLGGWLCRASSWDGTPYLLAPGTWPGGGALDWNETLPAPRQVPLGAIVATCELVDVAPIGGPFSFRTGIWEGDEGDFPGQPVVVRSPAHLSLGSESLVIDHGKITDVSDQLPYGDFTEGRWAWLLEDIQPVEPPVPCRGHQGLWIPSPDVLQALP